MSSKAKAAKPTAVTAAANKRARVQTARYVAPTESDDADAKADAAGEDMDESNGDEEEEPSEQCDDSTLSGFIVNSDEEEEAEEDGDMDASRTNASNAAEPGAPLTSTESKDDREETGDAEEEEDDEDAEEEEEEDGDDGDGSQAMEATLSEDEREEQATRDFHQRNHIRARSANTATGTKSTRVASEEEEDDEDDDEDDEEYEDEEDHDGEDDEEEEEEVSIVVPPPVKTKKVAAKASTTKAVATKVTTPAPASKSPAVGKPMAAAVSKPVVAIVPVKPVTTAASQVKVKSVATAAAPAPVVPVTKPTTAAKKPTAVAAAAATTAAAGAAARKPQSKMTAKILEASGEAHASVVADVVVFAEDGARHMQQIEIPAMIQSLLNRYISLQDKLKRRKLRAEQRKLAVEAGEAVDDDNLDNSDDDEVEMTDKEVADDIDNIEQKLIPFFKNQPVPIQYQFSTVIPNATLRYFSKPKPRKLDKAVGLEKIQNALMSHPLTMNANKRDTTHLTQMLAQRLFDEKDFIEVDALKFEAPRKRVPAVGRSRAKAGPDAFAAAPAVVVAPVVAAPRKKPAATAASAAAAAVVPIKKTKTTSAAK